MIREGKLQNVVADYLHAGEGRRCNTCPCLRDGNALVKQNYMGRAAGDGIVGKGKTHYAVCDAANGQPRLVSTPERTEGSKFSVAGNTTGNVSLPAAALSNLGVGSTKA